MDKDEYRQRFFRLHAAFAMLAAIFAPNAAFAHHVMDGGLPATFVQGLLSGFGHPVIGLDHLAFLAGVTLLGGLAGARMWAPLAFVAATIAGVGLHLWSIDIPGSELIIAISVALAAICLLFQISPGALAVTGAAAVFGIVHGYAYGESIVGADRGVVAAYLLGLAIVQMALAAAIVYALAFVARQTQTTEAAWSRVAGGLMAIVAVVALSSSVIAG